MVRVASLRRLLRPLTVAIVALACYAVVLPTTPSKAQYVGGPGWRGGYYNGRFFHHPHPFPHRHFSPRGGQFSRGGGPGVTHGGSGGGGGAHGGSGGRR